MCTFGVLGLSCDRTTALFPGRPPFQGGHLGGEEVSGGAMIYLGQSFLGQFLLRPGATQAKFLFFQISAIFWGCVLCDVCCVLLLCVVCVLLLLCVVCCVLLFCVVLLLLCVVVCYLNLEDLNPKTPKTPEHLNT